MRQKPGKDALMGRVGKYRPEFSEPAVVLVWDGNHGVGDVARELSSNHQLLRNWAMMACPNRVAVPGGLSNNERFDPA